MNNTLLPKTWDPKRAADEVLRRSITVTAPPIQGAHDADLVIVGGRAHIVVAVNDLRAGHSDRWPETYCTMIIVDIATMTVIRSIPFARSEQSYSNTTLPFGQCFVPRLIQKDSNTVRCYFTSQDPGIREAQVWYIDFLLDQEEFVDRIEKVKLKTSLGVFDMQPCHFHADAAAFGFRKPAVDYGLYLCDSFKEFDGQVFVAINNYPGKQNALARVSPSFDMFEIVGHYNEPQELDLSESAVNRLPDGTWIAICRQDTGNCNYVFITSPDGRVWTTAGEREFVSRGTNSKPTFDFFNGVYYLGWQEKAPLGAVDRSIFNIDISKDCETWERKYRFVSNHSFQYPTFKKYGNAIYFTASQGTHSYGTGGQDRIVFGVLETLS